MDKELEKYLQSKGVHIIDLSNGIIPEGFGAQIQQKKNATDNSHVEVQISDLESFLVENAPEHIQNQYFKHLIEEYGFFNPVIAIKKQDITVYAYNDSLHLMNRFSIEDRKLLAQIHSVLLYRKQLLPINLKGRMLELINEVTGNNIPVPLFVYADQWNKLENRHKADFQPYNWEDIPMPHLN